MASLYGLTSHSARGDVSVDTLLQLRRAMEFDPVASACLRLLQASVVGKGLDLHRGGKPVTLKPAFRAHLDAHWLPFCMDAVAALLAWGFVPLCLSKLGHRTSLFGHDASEESSPASEPLRERQRKIAAENRFPVVPLLEALAIRHVDDEDGLTRTYELHFGNKVGGTDDSKVPDSAVYVMSAPTLTGDPQSTMATLHEGGTFLNALTRHALEAEAIRSRQAIITAVDNKNVATSQPAYDPSTWFVDRESRELGEYNQSNADQSHFEHLVVASRLADELNKDRFDRRQKEQQQQQASTRETSGGSSTGAPADTLPVSLFCAPAGQSVVSGLRAPEARTDLTALVKQRIEQIAVAFSVPSALVSEGSRFAQHASTQLWSFNARVSSLSHHLGTLLTQVYQHLTGDDTAMLVVTPRPLRSIAELLDVHKAKTLTRTTLTPLVMAELGIGTEDAIEAELKRQEEEAAAEEALLLKQQPQADASPQSSAPSADSSPEPPKTPEKEVPKSAE